MTLFPVPTYRPVIIGVGIWYALGLLYFAVIARHSLVAQAPEEAFALVLPGREGDGGAVTGRHGPLRGLAVGVAVLSAALAACGGGQRRGDARDTVTLAINPWVGSQANAAVVGALLQRLGYTVEKKALRGGLAALDATAVGRAGAGLTRTRHAP